MAKGWLDNYGKQENYNDSNTSVPKGYEGEGYSMKGRNYSPAWGGQFQMGGSVYPVNYVPQAQEGMKVPSRKDYKTQGQYNAALKTHKLNLHKHELANNPEKIKGESDKDYENRTKYFNFKVRQEENKNPVSKAYLEMKDNQNADPDAVTRTLRQIATSPVHVGYGIYNAANPNNLDKYKSRATKNNEDLDLTNSSLDAASLLVPFDYGMKASPLWKQAATRTVKEVAEDEGFNLLKAGNKWINSFQTGGSLPGATGHMYARYEEGGKVPGDVGFSYPRTGEIPSNGPYAKKTMASAQNGKEMSYYQNGLDFKPKSISKNGGWLDKHDVAQTGKQVEYGTPEYREAYNRGEVVTDEGGRSPIQLDEVIVNKKSPTPGFWKQSRDRYLEEHQDDDILGAIGSVATYPLGVAQQAMMYGLTGKVQTPTEGMGIRKGMEGLPGTILNAVVDPANLIGAGILTKENALAKLETSIAPELRQGLQTNGFLDMFKSKPKKVYDFELKGQDWLHNWQNDPITLNKIKVRENNIDLTEILKKNYEDNIGKLSAKELNESQNKVVREFNRNKRSVGIKNNIKDVDILNYDDLKKIDPNIYDKYVNTSGGLSYNNNVYVKPSDTMDLEPVDVHELTHYLESNGKGFTLNERKELTEPFGVPETQTWDGNFEYDDTYYTDPTEIHARMNEARYDLRLDPKDKFTEKHFDERIKHDNFSGMGKYIKDKKGFINLMNNFYTPAAVIGLGGAGAVSQIEQKKQGGVIKDNRGQWDHPGEITEIGSNEITMEGVPYDVLGVSDTGDTKLMKPGKNYKFKGKKVTEYPMAKNGLRQEQKSLQNLDQLTNFTNYNKPQPGGWLNKYN